MSDQKITSTKNLYLSSGRDMLSGLKKRSKIKRTSPKNENFKNVASSAIGCEEELEDADIKILNYLQQCVCNALKSTTEQRRQFQQAKRRLKIVKKTIERLKSGQNTMQQLKPTKPMKEENDDQPKSRVKEENRWHHDENSSGNGAPKKRCFNEQKEGTKTNHGKKSKFDENLNENNIVKMQKEDTERNSKGIKAEIDYASDAEGRAEEGEEHKKYVETEENLERKLPALQNDERQTAEKPVAKNNSYQPQAIAFNPNLQDLRQCYGPSCGKPAKNGYKYCSDECGMALADARLQTFFGATFRTAHYERHNRKYDVMLQDLIAKMSKIRERWTNIEQQQSALNLIIKRAAGIKAKIQQSEAHKMEHEDLPNVDCVICGNEISLRNCIRHMDNCYMKQERRVSNSGSSKSHDDLAHVYCDAYDKIEGTFCKQLRVLCPEHNVESKISELTACGCPLGANRFKLDDNFCCQPKKSCDMHWGWQKLCQAELHQESILVESELDGIKKMFENYKAEKMQSRDIIAALMHPTGTYYEMAKNYITNQD